MEKVPQNNINLIKIAITGPEATGKTWLTKKLAEHYKTSFAPEFARSYLEKLNRAYGIRDLDKIAIGQIENERNAIKTGKDIVFFDTDLLVLKIWSQFRFGRVSELIEDLDKKINYDFHLLCYPDIEWEHDPLRESPDSAERRLLFGMYLKELRTDASSKFTIIKGHGESRLIEAIHSVNRYI